jgi:hypothetical protein
MKTLRIRHGIRHEFDLPLLTGEALMALTDDCSARGRALRAELGERIGRRDRRQAERHEDITVAI